MSRKNVFDLGEEPSRPTEGAGRPPQSDVRPLMGMGRSVRPAAPIGAISHSLGEINAKVKRAEEIERSLAEGQVVLDLDPDKIDDSIIPDRMASSDEDNRLFVDAIRENGQQVPILVRPKPGDADRYEVAYGHRRLRAVRALGRRVRAVVRPLSDAELVVAQGQENSARTDLTFIERARFAARLEERDFKRETIMAALNIDKGGLSRLISIATKVPASVIEAIGPAPAIGRGRWQELAELLSTDANKRRAQAQFGDGTQLVGLDSDARFERVFKALSGPSQRTAAATAAWTAKDGCPAARIQKVRGRISVAFDERSAPDFGEFVVTRLQVLYDEYRAAKIGTN